jgi:hypothetical protein
MDMIAHQTIYLDIEAVSIRVFFQAIQVTFVVMGMVEDIASLITSLRDMIGYIRDNYPWWPWHYGNILSNARDFVK